MSTISSKTFPLTEQSIVMTDLDGTAMSLIADPKLRRVNEYVYEALTEFNRLYPGQVIGVTGRDTQQVLDCFEGPAPFAMITSNGAKLTTATGQNHTYSFSSKELDFISYFRSEMSAFQKKYPQMVTEVKEYEVGFHAKPDARYAAHVTSDEITGIANKCSHLLYKFASKAAQHKLPFAICGVGEVGQMVFNHQHINKLTSISFFSRHLPCLPNGRKGWENVIYFGDCLREGGNDRSIAAEVRKRGGVVVQVINNNPDNIPSSGDEAEPHYAVATPQDMGIQMLRWMAYLEPTKLKAPTRKRVHIPQLCFADATP